MATRVTQEYKVFILRTQRQRAAFCRKYCRDNGISVQELASASGKCWSTIDNFLYNKTKDPRTETTRAIFFELGYDVAFKQRANSRGMIEL
tara:strand:- start:14724 stop:14996 length:273 start_codon:yes stop_codon:yes gene_type:complete